MNGLKRITALLLALLLVMSPISTVYALENDDYESSGTTEPSTGDGLVTSNPSEEPSTEEDNTSEPLEEPKQVTNALITLQYGVEVVEGAWCNSAKDLVVSFTDPEGIESASLAYTYRSGSEETIVEVVVTELEDGNRVAVVPSNTLSDGVYSFSAVCKGNEDDEGIVLLYELKLDTTCVDYSSVVVSGLSIIDEVGYAKETVYIEGFTDATSGVKSIATINSEGVVTEYKPEEVIIVDSTVETIRLEDNAGNISEVPVSAVVGCNSLVFDSNVPVISIERDGSPAYKDDSRSYYGAKYTVIASVEDNNLDSVVYYKNGELVETHKTEGNSTTISYVFEDSGTYDIELIVSDKSGNVVSHKESFAIDTIAPEKGELSVVGEWCEVDENIYIKSPISVKGTPVDSISSVERVEVLKNGEVVGYELPFSIFESGLYSINVYDNVGNVLSLPLSDVMGSGSSNVVVDTNIPFASVSTEVDGVDGLWFTSIPNVVISVLDDNFKSAVYTIYIDGVESDSKTIDSSTEGLTVDMSSYVGSVFRVVVDVEDLSGNKNSSECTFNVDNVAPEPIGVEVGNPSAIKCGNVYFNGQFEIVISATDGTGYGNLTYYLNEVSSKDGRFTISSNGYYAIKVVDGLGNESLAVDLCSCCGWNGNSIIINNVNPTIDWEKHSGSWLPSTCTYDVLVNSEVGIDSIVVTVNGFEVVRKSYDTLDVNTESFKVDISEATISENSSYSTVITITDNSGLVSTATDVVFVDLNKPEIGSISVDGAWEIHDNKLYTKGAITINGSPSDVESGIKLVEVLKDDFVVGSLPYTITESGKYSIRVTDNVDNTIVFSFAEVAGVSTSDIVWDNTFPSVYFDLAKSDKPQYTDEYTYWYAENPLVYVGMTDSNMQSVSVTVVIDGAKTVVVSDVLENGIYAIDTAYAQGSVFEVYAEARDKSGNVSTSSYKFRVDSVKPQVGSLSAVADPEWFEVDGCVYTNGTFALSGYPMDEESGIKDVTVYYSSINSDDVVAEKYTQDINLVVNNEDMSGVYYIEVTDNVGNVYVVKACELLGSLSNNFIVDLTAPTITRTDNNAETKPGWYNYSPVFAYTIGDTYISEYSVFVNNDLIKSGTESESISVDTVEYANMTVTIRIEAKDKAGNVSTYEYSYRHDNTPPSEINISMDSPVGFKENNVYYNSSISLSISASDYDYGNIVYYINGEKLTDDEYTVSKSGEYSFRVEDGLGNSTATMTLAEFLNWSGNNIVIDESAPVITSTKFNGKWIKGIGSYSISISDNLGIDSIVATVNGNKKIVTKVEAIDDVSKVIELNTSMAALNSDGSVNIVVTVTDNSGLTTTWDDVVYVDNVIPTVDNFVVHGDVNRVDTTTGYGFFFNGDGSVDVACSDGSPSSGIASIWTRLSGQDWVEHVVNESGVVSVKIPKEFKGTLEAYVVDHVGNKSEIKSSIKMVSETYATHNSNSNLTITMPETPYKDINGLPLYNSDTSALLTVGCSWSGLQYLEWGINGLNRVADFANGIFEDNIVTKYSQNVPLTGNANGLVMSVNIADWSNNRSSESVMFSIDKDAPVITVTYDSYVDNGYYNKARVASITVTERNFDASKFIVSGESGELGTWSNDGNVWTNSIRFVDDGDYSFTLDCTDRAGNKAIHYVSETFTVDKISPVMSVTWNNDNVKNGMYYNDERIATVTVTEHNFDAALFKLTGDGTLTGWTSNGDTHTATVRFESDGEYEFSFGGSDKAGNSTAEDYSSGIFIIDLTAPSISIDRVSDGVSYKNEVELLVTVSDVYISENTKVYLSGKMHDEIEISGNFNAQTGTFSYSNFPKEEIVDDIYSIRVVAVDKAGNESEDYLTFSVNRFGSTYSFYNADVLDNYLATPVDISISEVNVDKLDISKVVVTVTKDGEEISVPNYRVKIIEEESGGKFLYTYTIDKGVFEEDGKYSVSITSQAEEGTKYTSVAEQYDFVIDKTDPVVIVSGVEEGENYREYDRVVTVDVRDLSGVKSVKVYVNNTEVTDYTVTDDIYRFIVTESKEYQTVKVEVVDKAGNKTTVSVGKFLITSSLMVYLLNQFWFLAVIAIVLFLIIIMIILLLSNRRKEKDEEQEALEASGELYRSTSGTGSSGTTGGASSNENQILSGEAPTVEQGDVLVNEVNISVVNGNGESTTGFMSDDSPETGVMD